MEFHPHLYQDDTIDWMNDRVLVHGHDGGLIFHEPGLGKTVTLLSWFNQMLRLRYVRRMVVVAPIRVRDNVWPSEHEQWDHLKHLRVVRVGSGKWPDPGDAEVITVNPESLAKLPDYCKKHNLDPDVLVVDESGDFRTWSSKRMRWMRKNLKQFKYRWCLTATPVPETVMDVFPQSWIVDMGATLGSNITQFRNRFCYRGGFDGKEWILHKGNEKVIAELVSPMCLTGSVNGCLWLPERRSHLITTPLGKGRKYYAELEKKEMLTLDDGTEVIPKNAGTRRNLLKQICNGCVYDDDKQVHRLHADKLDQLVSAVRHISTPVMIAYQYDHDLMQLTDTYPTARVINGKTSSAHADETIRLWNESEVPILLVQPQALSHGVNMQKGTCRDVFWFSLPDSLLVFQQLNTRVYRQGVQNPVTIHQLVTRNTVDRALVGRLDRKAIAQAEFLSMLPTVDRGCSNGDLKT